MFIVLCINHDEVPMKALRIIIADDNYQFRNSIINYINANVKFESISWSSTSEDTINKVILNNYDLVIMDYSLDGLNGVETTKKIKSFNKDIKIIITSISNQKQYREEYLTAGADEFVPKSYLTQQLVPIINKTFIN